MWHILIAEIKHNRIITLIAYVYAVCMILFLFYLSISHWEASVPIVMLVLLATPMLAGYAGDFRTKQKRDRLHFVLPISANQLGIVRLIYPLAIWLTILVIYKITMLLLSEMMFLEFSQSMTRLRSNPISYEQLLSLNGWILIINALYLIFVDFQVTSTEKNKQQLLFLLKNTLPFLAMMPFIIWLFIANHFRDQMSIADFLGDSMNSLVSIIGFNLCGLALSILSVRVFTHRSSYLNS